MSGIEEDDLPDWTMYLTSPLSVYMAVRPGSQSLFLSMASTSSEMAGCLYSAHLEDQARLANAQSRVPRVDLLRADRKFVNPIVKQSQMLKGKESFVLPKPQLSQMESIQDSHLSSSHVQKDKAYSTNPDVYVQPKKVWPSQSLEISVDVIFGLHTEKERVRSGNPDVVNLYDLDSPYREQRGYWFSAKTFSERDTDEFHNIGEALFEVYNPQFDRAQTRETRWQAVEASRDCCLTLSERRPWVQPKLQRRMLFRSTTIGVQKHYLEPVSCGALLSRTCHLFTCGIGCSKQIETLDPLDLHVQYSADQILHSSQFLNLDQPQLYSAVMSLRKNVSPFLLFQAVVRWSLRHISIRMVHEPIIESTVREYQALHNTHRVPPHLVRSIIDHLLPEIPLTLFTEAELKYVCQYPSLFSIDEQRLLWRVRYYSSLTYKNFIGPQNSTLYSKNAVQQHKLPYLSALGDAYGENVNAFSDGTKHGDPSRMDEFCVPSAYTGREVLDKMYVNENRRMMAAFETVLKNDLEDAKLQTLDVRDGSSVTATTEQAEFCRQLAYGQRHEDGFSLNNGNVCSPGDVFVDYRMADMRITRELCKTLTAPHTKSQILPIGSSDMTKCHWAYIMHLQIFRVGGLLSWIAFFATLIILNVYNSKGYSFADGSLLPMAFLGVFFIITPFVHCAIQGYQNSVNERALYAMTIADLPDTVTVLETWYSIIYDPDETISLQAGMLPVTFGTLLVLFSVHFSEIAHIPTYAFFIPFYIMMFTHIPCMEWCFHDSSPFDLQICFLYWIIMLPVLISAILMHLTLTVRDYSGLVVFSPQFLLVAYAIVFLLYICCDSDSVGVLAAFLFEVTFFLGIIFLALFLHNLWTPHNSIWSPSFPVMMIPWWLIIFVLILAYCFMFCDPNDRNIYRGRVFPATTVDYMKHAYRPYTFNTR